MTVSTRLVVACCLAAAACGGGKTGGRGGGANGSGTVDSGGGTVSLPGGPAINVPPGALATATPITITQAATTPPAGAITPVFEFGPAGTDFASPITVTFDVPAGTQSGSVSIYWTKAGSPAEYDPIQTTVSGTTASGQVTHFSSGFVGAPCATGTECTPANPCRHGQTTCNGTPACADLGTNVADGTACGGGNVCSAGTCAPPTRTVTGAFQTTYWPDSGSQTTVAAPQPIGTTVAVLVPDASPSGYARIAGTMNVDGTFAIPGVPTGTYFLEIVGPSSVTVTEHTASTVTFTDLTSARPDLAYVTQPTPVTLDVANLDPWQPAGTTTMPDVFEIVSSQAAVFERPWQNGGTAPKPTAGATTYQGTMDWNDFHPSGLPDASKGDVVIFYQMHRASVGSGATLNYYRAATKGWTTNALTLADGQSSAVSMTLAPIPQDGSLPMNVTPSTYDPILPMVNPAAVADSTSVEVWAVPHTSGYPAPAKSFGRLIYLILSPGTPNVDYGAIAYPHALAGWAEFIATGLSASVSFLAPGATSPASYAALVTNWETNTAPYAVPFAPAVSPVQAPKIDGQDAFGALAGIGPQPTLTWMAPVIGAPTSYGVSIYGLGADAGAKTTFSAILSATVYSGRSFKVPPGVLSTGNTYFAVITANDAPWDVVDRDGWLAGYPFRFADCVTAAFTVGAGAQPPSPPTDVTALPGNGSATVSWTPSAGASGYHVYYSAAPPVTTGSPSVTVSGPPATIPGLANGTAYSFAVSSMNAAGESALSAMPCAVPTTASTAGLTLYDPLCGTSLDGAKWQNPGVYSLGVSGGAAALSVDMADIPSRTIRNDVYNAIASVAAGTARVTTLTADVTIPAATAARSGGVQLRAAVRLLYSPPWERLNFPGANLDLIVVEAGLIEAGGGLYAYRQLSHCDDASCASVSATGVATVDPAGFATVTGLAVGAPASYDVTYTVTASLDESTGLFHWTIAGGSLGSPGVSGSADFSAYLAAMAGWTGVSLAGSGFQAAQIVARAFDSSVAGGGSGKLTARFGNVSVGFDNAPATPFDDFSGTGGNSGPSELSLAKWSDGTGNNTTPSGGSVAAATLLSGGGLVIHSQVTADAATAPLDSHVLNLSNPTSANTIQADVTVASSFTGTTAGRGATAFLQGRFYNTGTAGTTPPNVNEPYSAVGDVSAQVSLQSVANNASYAVLRCETATCGTYTVLGSGAIPGVTVGTGVHTLVLRWDPVTTVFTFGIDGQVLSVDPTRAGPGGVNTPAPYAKAANAPFRRVLTNLAAPQGAGNAGSFDVKLNNVFTAP